jgi:Bacterial SH3 domain
MILRLVCASVALVLSAANLAARPGIAVTTVNLRANPDTASEVLGKIPGGSRVDVGDCTNGWCAVTWQGRSGHAIATAIDGSGRAPLRAVRRPIPGAPGYDPGDDDVVPGPGYAGPYGPQPVYGPRPYYGPYGYGYGGYWGPRFGWGWRRW